MAANSSAAFIVLTRSEVLEIISDFQEGISMNLSLIFKRFRHDLENQQYKYELSQYRRSERFRGYVLCQLIMEKNVNAALELLHTFDAIESPQSTQVYAYAIDNAAYSKSLELVKLLHERNIGICTSNAMDTAASNGSFDIVVFLHYNRTEGCTRRAFDNAKAYGYKDIEMFLWQHRQDDCKNKMRPTRSYGFSEIGTAGFEETTKCVIQ